MKKHFRAIVVAILLAAFFASPALAGEDQFFGTLTGATIGGIVGNQFGKGSGRDAATVAGILAGGWAGNDIGYAMDNRSSSQASAGGGYRAPAGPITYRSSYEPNYVGPDDSPSPETIYDNAGSTCREYSQQVRVNGRIQESYGTACLQPDGTWRAVDE